MTNEQIIEKYWDKINLDLHQNQIEIIKQMLNEVRNESLLKCQNEKEMEQPTYKKNERERCEQVSSYPIGFINWKELKYK